VRQRRTQGLQPDPRRRKSKTLKSAHPEYRDGRTKTAISSTSRMPWTRRSILHFTPGAQGCSTSDPAGIHVDRVGNADLSGNSACLVEIDFIDLPASLREKYQYYTRADISRLLATGWQGPAFSLERPSAITCVVISFRDWNCSLPSRSLLFDETLSVTLYTNSPRY